MALDASHTDQIAEVNEPTVENPGNVEPPEPSSNATCLLDTLDIAILDTEKRFNSGSVNLRDAYTVYLIETKAKENQGKKAYEQLTNIWRRYSEFEMLKDYLQSAYPFVVIPPLPEKKVLFPWQNSQPDKFQADFVDRRKAGLENFLLRVATHKILSHDKVFRQFLQQDDPWNESIASLSYLGKADVKLKSLSATFMLKKPIRQFEETKNYSNELHSNISNLLKIRARLADRLYCIHKLHNNYGRVFTEWSTFEKHMGEELPKAAHMMTVFANLVDGIDEEEQFVDQMKEYLFFAESLRNVCKKQEMLQYEVERSDDNFAAKSLQRENLLKGKVSFMTRWFANVETDEVRELKLQQIDAQIHEAESRCHQSADEASNFVEKAQEDIDQFQLQKVKDIKESLILYAILQIKMCKKSLSVWTNIRDSFENI